MKAKFVINKKGRVRKRLGSKKIMQQLVDYAMKDTKMAEAMYNSYSHAMTHGTGIVKVKFNGQDYQVPSWTADSNTGYYHNSNNTISFVSNGKEKPMTQKKQIEYFEYKWKEAQDECRYKDQRINELNSELTELKRPSRNPVIRTLKAISMIPLAPVLLIASIVVGLVECGNDSFNRVFRNRY